MGNESAQYAIADIRQLVVEIFIAHKTDPSIAARVADALIHAELMGQKGHGLSRVSSYAAQALSGKVDGHAKPVIATRGESFVRVDALYGFAYPAIDLAIEEMTSLARRGGIAGAAIFRSHHCGQLGAHVEALAREGLVGLMFANTPKAMAPWGGAEAVFGTNPIAFSSPREADDPIVIDLALSKVARGKIMAAKKAEERIPEGWALDQNGQPTQDPAEALDGTMIPMADAKGASLALMVEILSATLTGAFHAFEASSFFDAEGAPPSVGQFILALDPDALSGGAYFGGIEKLTDEILAQEGARLPGVNGIQKRRAKMETGQMELTKAQYSELTALRMRD